MGVSKKRFVLKTVGLLSLAGLVILGLSGCVNQQSSSQSLVTRYLGDLKTGNLVEALKISDVAVPAGERSSLTDKFYKNTKSKITSYSPVAEASDGKLSSTVTQNNRNYLWNFSVVNNKVFTVNGFERVLVARYPLSNSKALFVDGFFLVNGAKLKADNVVGDGYILTLPVGLYKTISTPKEDRYISASTSVSVVGSAVLVTNVNSYVDKAFTSISSNNAFLVEERSQIEAYLKSAKGHSDLVNAIQNQGPENFDYTVKSPGVLPDLVVGNLVAPGLELDGNKITKINLNPIFVATNNEDGSVSDETLPVVLTVYVKSPYNGPLKFIIKAERTNLI